MVDNEDEAWKALELVKKMASCVFDREVTTAEVKHTLEALMARGVGLEELTKH